MATKLRDYYKIDETIIDDYIKTINFKEKFKLTIKMAPGVYAFMVLSVLFMILLGLQSHFKISICCIDDRFLSIVLYALFTMSFLMMFFLLWRFSKGGKDDLHKEYVSDFIELRRILKKKKCYSSQSISALIRTYEQKQHQIDMEVDRLLIVVGAIVSILLVVITKAFEFASKVYEYSVQIGVVKSGLICGCTDNCCACTGSEALYQGLKSVAEYELKLCFAIILVLIAIILVYSISIMIKTTKDRYTRMIRDLENIEVYIHREKRK